MKNLLFDTAPLVVNPELACAIGINEAIVLQQLHYWVNINEKACKNLQDGHYWTYNTVSEWQKQFPWISEITIKRMLIRLEKDGFIITGRYNKKDFDRTKWYRIDYEKIKSLLVDIKNNDLDDTLDSDLNDTVQRIKMIPPIPETTQRLPESNSYNGFSVPKNDTQIYDKSILTFINWYRLDLYQQAYGKDHPRLKKEQLTSVHDCLKDFLADMPINVDCLKEMAISFIKNVRSNDHNINHFAQRGMLDVRYYDSGLY